MPPETPATPPPAPAVPPMPPLPTPPSQQAETSAPPPGMTEIHSDPAAQQTPEQLETLIQAALAPPPPEPEPAEAAPPPPAEPAKAAELSADLEAASKPSADERLEEISMRLEEEGLRRERLELQLEHERRMRDTSSSQAGYYKRVAIDLAREAGGQPAAEPEEPLDYGDEPPPAPASRRSPETQRLVQEVSALRVEAVERATVDVFNHFAASHQDMSELAESMKPLIAQGRQQHAALMDSGDPKLVRQTTELILKSAYLDAKASKVATKRAEAETKRASQFAAMTAAKLSATAAGGTAAASAAPAHVKPPSQMSDDELNAAIARLMAAGR